jgi:hypothetical protein
MGPFAVIILLYRTIQLGRLQGQTISELIKRHNNDKLIIRDVTKY